MTEGDNTARVRQRFGHYEILGPLGRGGMGVVYRALDLTLDRVVALKVLHDHLRTRPQCVSRLQREARAIAGLNHSNIVQVYSVGEIGRVAYFAMEHVDGRPLSSVLIQEGPMLWERALGIAAQIADALACAHEAQIVHRDVKPPNIILTEDDHVYVTDFGVAKVLTAETQLTVDASRLGTPSYMSPEHCQNAEVTAASDFYSLGVLIFQMISGRLPHEASTRAGLVNKIIGSPPARLRDYVPDVPEGVDRLVAHLLEKRPKDRPANGRVLCDLIERVRSGATLDEDCRDRVAAMATLRKSLAETPTPHTPSSGGDESGERRSGRTRPSSSAGDRTTTQGWRVAPRRWLVDGGWRSVAWILAIWAGICSTTTGALLGHWDAPALYTQVEEPGIAGWSAPAEVAAFTDLGKGVVLARLNVPDSTLQGAGWLSAASGACILTGRSGTFLCSLNLAPRHASAHFLPQPESGTLSVLDFCGAIHRDSPLAGHLLMAHPANGSVGAWSPASTETKWWSLTANSPGLRAAAVAAVPSNGRYLATGTSSPEHPAQWNVVQFDMGFDGPGGSPRTLSHPGAPVAALQYSPDGLRLAYLRESALGQRELWVVRTDGSEAEGSLIARGNLLLPSAAFSPDGSRVAAVNRAVGNRGQLQVSPAAGAGLEAAGDAVDAAWHPSGEYLVVTAPDRSGRLQLWTVEARAPYRRVALTSFETGLLPTCRISPDGSQALSLLEEASGTAVAFIRLSPPAF